MDTWMDSIMIPQGRLSTVPVITAYLGPEDRPFKALESYEKGPIAIEDTSEGLLYQNWTLDYNDISGDITLIPELTGLPVVIDNIADIKYITFTFDQNARVTLTYSTSVSSFLYWYDTALGYSVTADLGSDIITPSIYLDDKRSTQNTANDMLLWYTKLSEGGLYELYMLRQRDRFLIEYLMTSGLTQQYILNIGMSDALRVQIKLTDLEPV